MLSIEMTQYKWTHEPRRNRWTVYEWKRGKIGRLFGHWEIIFSFFDPDPTTGRQRAEELIKRQVTSSQPMTTTYYDANGRQVGEF